MLLDSISTFGVWEFSNTEVHHYIHSRKPVLLRTHLCKGHPPAKATLGVTCENSLLSVPGRANFSYISLQKGDRRPSFLLIGSSS